jgi:N-acetylneuraminic acid mutarotase
MPTARLGLTSSIVDGKIYAIGGYPSAGGLGMTTNEVYDPATDTWTIKADMPTGRRWLSSSAVNGKIYVFGGYTLVNEPGLSTVEEYDPATDTWRTKTPMPTARLGPACCVVDGIIYVIGGASIVSQQLKTVEAYDPVTDTWTKKADLLSARMMLNVNAVNGKIYAIGGRYGSLKMYTLIEEYDPATDTWKEKFDMPINKGGYATSVMNNKIYVIGGVNIESGDWNIFSDIDEYDPIANTWANKADMPTKQWGLTASTVDGKIYAVGGSSLGINAGHPGTRTVYEYDPILPADFNKDEAVDVNDLVILIEHWGTDEPLCDIAPILSGDGIVDINDLELFLHYREYAMKDFTLIAHWKLDETESDVAYDSAGEHDSTINGDPLWQPEGGMVDGALELDGQDDYVTTGLVLDPSTFGPISVLAWIKGGAPGQVIISQENGVNWLMADPSEGKLMTALSRPAGGRIPATPMISESIITDNTWHRIGLVWDGLYRSLYVDGDEVARDTTTLSGLEGSDGVLYLGAGSTLAPETFFSGLIDDVRIHDRAITP